MRDGTSASSSSWQPATALTAQKSQDSVYTDNSQVHVHSFIAQAGAAAGGPCVTTSPHDGAAGHRSSRHLARPLQTPQRKSSSLFGSLNDAHHLSTPVPTLPCFSGQEMSPSLYFPPPSLSTAPSTSPLLVSRLPLSTSMAWTRVCIVWSQSIVTTSRQRISGVLGQRPISHPQSQNSSFSTPASASSIPEAKLFL